MSSILTWTCFLLWIGFSLQDKTPDVTVTCFVSEECFLPCSFQPGGEETVEWFRQDVVVYKFERSDDDDDSSSSSKEHVEHDQLDGRASVSPHLVTRGNATLILKRSSLKDRGTYRCHVHTKRGEHTAKVILKVEAPIQGLFLELSRLSGYEEMKCTVRDVFPAPRVTWATEPPTFEDLRPVTRMQADKKGLYTVDSRLKKLTGQPDLIYICKVTTSYGGPAWTAQQPIATLELLQRRGSVPHPQLRQPVGPQRLVAVVGRPRGAGRLQGPVRRRIPAADGPQTFGAQRQLHLRVLDAAQPAHRTQPSHHRGERSTAEDQSHWWIVAVVVVGLVLALVGMLAYLKLRGNHGDVD